MIEIIDGEEYEITTLPGGAVIKELKSNYTPPPPVPPAQLSPYAFKRLIGTELRLAIRAAAGTDPIIFDFLDLLNSADVIDFDDAVGGPKQGMDYLLAIGLIDQDEHDRIMRREFP